MKICFITGAFPKMKCGVGDYCNKLAKELSSMETEVYVITSVSADINVTGVKVFNVIENWNKSATERIITILKEIKPDVVNIQYPSNEYKDAYYIFNILPLIIKLKIRCKLTETIHEYDLEPLSKQRKIRYYFNFKLMSKIIVVEEIFKELIQANFKNVDVKYIQISSNIPKMNVSNEEKKKIQKQFGLFSDNIISYFGFINEKKGVEKLLNCISKLDDIQLLIIGELKKENDYHNMILNLIEKLDIKDKVKITGFVEDPELVAKYINATDLCVLPFANGVQKRNGSFLAAYNQDVPVITTSANMLDDKDGIYYVECNDEEKLIKKINYVLNQNEKIYREELNWRNVANQYISNLNNK